jgi:hypothetical protein
MIFTKQIFRRRNRIGKWSMAGALLLLCASVSFVRAQATLEDPQEKIIHYDSAVGLADPVTLLQQRLAAGTARLKFDPIRGYLPGLLKELRVPVSSQGLVFSKTSSQRPRINPQTPRAVYFNDSVAVGWVPGGNVIELASVDPERGPIFYTLDQTNGASPRFVRGTDCMQCHLGPKTVNVPGLVVRSVLTDSNGVALSQVADFVNGHNSPLPERWGGWYVTGTHERDQHLGNLFFTDAGASTIEQKAQSEAPAFVTDLRNRFDTSRYLSPHSDIVALLVLEHQTRMQNLITRAGYETRYALAETNGWATQRIAQAGEMLLEYLLFRNEAPMKGTVRGTSGFAAEFESAGPRASRGRSLRQFDLETRLFRHPCSYMVYAPAFDALPRETKSYLWRRLEEILTGQDGSATYATMTGSDRQEVFEILLETKPEFAAWVHQPQVSLK